MNLKILFWSVVRDRDRFLMRQKKRSQENRFLFETEAFLQQIRNKREILLLREKIERRESEAIFT